MVLQCNVKPIFHKYYVVINDHNIFVHFPHAIATSSMMLTESTPTEISTPSSTPSTGMMMSSTCTEFTSSTT